jgi:hypothetical protein
MVYRLDKCVQKIFEHGLKEVWQSDFCKRKSDLCSTFEKYSAVHFATVALLFVACRSCVYVLGQWPHFCRQNARSLVTRGGQLQSVESRQECSIGSRFSMGEMFMFYWIRSLCCAVEEWGPKLFLLVLLRLSELRRLLWGRVKVILRGVLLLGDGESIADFHLWSKKWSTVFAIDK